MAKWDKPVIGPIAPTRGPPAAGHPIGVPQILPPPGVIDPFPILYTNPIYGSDPTAAGVTGESNTGPGVVGRSLPSLVSGAGQSDGVQGVSDGTGVHGISNGSGIGVYGESKGFDGVAGISHSPNHAGVSGHNDSGGAAGWFCGDVTVNGNLNLSNNLNIASTGDLILSDCAEHFDLADIETECGTVMVIDQDSKLRPSSESYDKKVAGVVSGGGNFRPGIVLGEQQPEHTSLPIALLGKVYCKVDANQAPIEVGDLLTTSSKPGHAMKAADPLKAFGAVIGKALRPLKEGQGLIPILVALQ